MRRLAVCAAAALLLCSHAGPGAAEPNPTAPPIAAERLPIPLDAAAWEKLAKRESIIETRPEPGHTVKSLLAIFVVDAPPERVFSVVTDNARLAEFMPYVAESAVRTAEDGTLLNTQRVDLPWPVPDLRYEIAIRKTVPSGADPAEPWLVQWKYVPGTGNVQENRGTWTLFHYGERATLVVYDNFVDPGGWTPAWIQDWASQRAMPRVVEAIRKRATGPTT